MGYVIAAYTVAIGAVGIYLLHLARERRSLSRELNRKESPPVLAVPAPPSVP